MGRRNFTADELRDMPTLSVGQADNLKVDTGSTRVWLCRLGFVDGMPYDDQITIEHLVDGRWVEVETYAG